MAALDWKLQQEIFEWRKHNFPEEGPLLFGLQLAEETGELARAMSKLHRGVRGSDAEWLAEIYKEIGDVFLALNHVANEYGFFLEDAVNARWATVKQRDYIKDPQQHGLPK